MKVVGEKVMGKGGIIIEKCSSLGLIHGVYFQELALLLIGQVLVLKTKLGRKKTLKKKMKGKRKEGRRKKRKKKSIKQTGKMKLMKMI